MHPISYVLCLVTTLFILIPALAFLFSWCCSIYFTNKRKYMADVLNGLVKALNGLSITTKKETTNDPS